MGCFDYIRCEYPLPDYPDTAPRDGFQTKDFCNECQEYTIDGDGKLTMTKRWSRENNYTTTVECNVNMPVTGQLNFYDGYKGKWYEYDAVFKDGTLIELARNMQLV